MAQFSVHEAKVNLSCLIADAQAGGEVVITRGSVPVVRQVSIKPQGRRAFGALKGAISMDLCFEEPLPDDELGDWNLA